MGRKYKTEEERAEARRQAAHRWYLKNRAPANPTLGKGRPVGSVNGGKTKEERKEELKEYNRQWHIKNRERINLRKAKHYHDNKPRYRQKKKEFRQRVQKIYHQFKNGPVQSEVSEEFDVRLKALEEKVQTLQDVMDMKELFNELSQDFQKLRNEMKFGKK